MLLFYIRHGHPTYTPDRLTPLGKRQAEAVSRRLALYGLDKIYSSTSTRAYETALPTSEILEGLPIEQLHWCNESLAYKDFSVPTEDGRVWSWSDPKVRMDFNRPDVRALGMNWYEHPCFAENRDRYKNGIDRISKELDAFLASHGYVHDRENCCYESVAPNDDRIALFAHEGFGMAFLSLLLDIPLPLYSAHFEISFTGVTVIEFPNEKGLQIPRILQHSNDSHLYRDGLPTNFQNRIRF